MTDVLTSRDGLIGNSPRYTNSISPPYQRYLKDDSGAAINLTGVSPSALSLVFVNQSNPLTVKAGAGSFSIPSGTASQGFAEYQYASADLAVAGNWYAFWTVQLVGEPSPRAFDPDFLEIKASPTAGGTPSVTVQDVNLTEVNGTAVSSSNPVPTSGPITSVDGGIATIGTTTDTSSANTTIGLLKAIKAYLGGTLTTSLSGALPAGTNVIGHVIVDSAGAVTITTLPSIPAGTNVIGHVVVDSGAITANAGTNLNTSLLALESGGNLATLAGAVSGSKVQSNIAQVAGATIGNTNPMPAQDIEQANYVALTTPPSTTNAGSDTALTFSSQVNRVIIMNNTSANVNYAFDTTASAGSLVLVPGAMLVYPKKCTVLHLYTAAAQNLNGTTAGNIVVLGAL